VVYISELRVSVSKHKNIEKVAAQRQQRLASLLMNPMPFSPM
jgi:hypothetical protein